MRYPPQNRSPLGEATIPQQSQVRQRILVADADPDVRLLHNLVLLHEGYRTDTVANGAIAWSLLKRNDYDLLITDHAMPKVSGVELLEKLDAHQMTLPVIMITEVFPEAEFRRQARLQPPTVLLKPVSGEQLLTTVKRVLATVALGSSAELK